MVESNSDNRRNILLIDNSVDYFSKIVDSIDLTKADVIVFDSNEHSYNDVIALIHNKNQTGYKSIGIIQHNFKLPYYQFTKKEKKCLLSSVEIEDPSLSSWNEFINFINSLKTDFSLSYLDLLACSLYSNSDWKYVINTIETQLQIQIRSSTDNTGSLNLGGNWFLETHTGINLKDVYFTEEIDSYDGILLGSAYQSLFITNSGSVYSCGYNSLGALGIGNTTDTWSPTLITSLSGLNIISASAGYLFSLFLTSSGTAYGTGHNYKNKLGFSATTDGGYYITTPQLVSTLSESNIVAISGGEWHSLFLLNTGQVYAAGENYYGQLGTGNTNDAYSPILISSLSGQNITGICASNISSFYITSSGAVYSTGYNSEGVLGLGDTTQRTSPTLISSLSGETIIKISSSNFTLFVTASGKVYGCGNNNNGQLGLGDTTNRSTPTLITSLSSVNIISVLAGSSHSLFLTSTGKVYACGYNANGQLGLNDQTNRSTPTLISNLSSLNIIKISGGGSHSIFLSDSGTVYTCGYNIYGQLGLGDTTQRLVPTQISGTYSQLSEYKSNLNNFTVGTKNLGDGAFIITPPISTVSTTYGSTWTQIGNTITGDGVTGATISKDGLTIAFVAVYDDTGGTNRGSVKVYRWSSNSWNQLGDSFYGLVDDQTFASITLGYDGNTIAINYTQAAHGSLNTSTKGFCAVFYYNSSKTTGSNDVTSELFGPTGWSILGRPIFNENNGDNIANPRLSGNNKIIAIGIPHNDGTSGNINDQHGSVRVFAYDSTKVTEVTDQSSSNFGPIGWNRIGLDIDGSNTNDYLGGPLEISVDGNIIAVGVPGADDLPSIMEGERGGQTNFGHTKVLYRNGTTWTQRGRNIYPQTYSIYDYNLYSPSFIGMSANGNIIVTGNRNYASYRGITSSWVWNPTSSDYMPLASQINEFGDWQLSGAVSLSTDGTVLAVGAYDADNNTSNGGTTRVYKLTTKDTTLIASAPSNMASYTSDVNFGGMTVNGTIYRVTITGAISGGTIWGTNIYTHDSNLAMAAVHAGVVANGETKEVYVVMERPQVYYFSSTRLGITSSAYGPVSGPYPMSNYASYFFQTEPRHWLKIGNDIFGSSGEFLGDITSLSSNGTKIICNGSNRVKVFSIDSFGQFSYTSSNTSVAKIYGDIVVPEASGQSTITATQSASGANSESTIIATLTVNSNSPTLSNFTVAAQNFGSSPFNLTAPTSNSNGSFSYTSSNTSVATISGSTVTIVGAGTSTITAIQAASGSYVSGTITATFTVNPIAPTISNFTIAAQNFGSSPFSLTAPTSNSDGSFTYTSSNTSVATISGSTVTIVEGGTSTITATQAATTNYTSGTITASFTVNPIAPTISNFTVAAQNFGSSPFSLTAPTSNSGGSFSYTSSNTSVATISGSTVTIVGAGTSTITATQASTTNYTSETITASFTVNQIAPTISNFTVTAQNFGASPFSLTAPTSNSGGSFTYTSSNTSVATISGSTVTIVGAGTSTITATQASTTNYTSGTITATFTVNQIAPTIGTLTIPSKNFGDSSFNIVLKGHTLFTVRNGGSDWQNRIINDDTSNTNIQYWNPDQQWYDTNYAPWNEIGLQFRFFAAYVLTYYNLTSSSASVILGGGNYGTYSFSYNGGTSYSASFYGTSTSWNYSLPITVNRNVVGPTSNSGGSFTYTSSNTSVATISDNTVTVVNAGSSTITATQASTTNYTSGTTTATFIVNPIAPTISNFTVAAQNFGSSPFSLTAPTSNSGGSFTYTSSNTSVATISGNTVTIVGGGSSTITATQASSTNYTSGNITATFTVNPIAPTISNFSVPNKKFGDLSFSLTAPTTNSAGSFSYTSSNTSVATISGSTATLVAPGTTTITATQAATSNYTSGTITATFTITPNQGIALSGDGLVFALGKPNFNSQAGKVDIYSWNGSTWIQKGSTLNGGASDSFGYSLSLSNTGNIIVIGAYSGQSTRGYAKVYEFVSNDWQLKGSQINGNNTNDEFTRSITLSSDGSTFAGGSPSSNYVKIFSWDGSAWAQKGSTLTGEASSRYGESISLSSDGSLIAIGAPNFSTNTGYTKLFEFVSSSWTQKGSTLNGSTNNEYFGYSVSLSGTDLVVGAYGGYNNTGYLKYYEWINNSWQQRGGTLSGSSIDDKLGYSVAISSNNKIVTGAYGLSSSTGQVNVYNYNPFPSNPTNGQVFYNVDDNNLYIYDDSGWVYTNFTNDGSIVGLTLNVSGDTTLSGNVGIGQAPSASYKLDILGTARASLFTTTSDYRIKENISIINEDVDELKPVKYKNKLNNKLEYGFIAHEVQDIFPEMVQGQKDGEEYQSINYLELIPIMVNEIKKLKEEIRNLKR